MSPKHYKPGEQRDWRYRGGRMSENKVAWLDYSQGQVLLFVNENEVQSDHDVILHFFTYRGKRPFTLPLTSLTKEELDKLKELIDFAHTWAEPITEERDKVAQDAFDKGDDTIARVYRQVPKLVVRQRPGDEHSKRLPIRPDGVPQSSGGKRDLTDGVRGASAGLAGDDSQQSESQDNSKEID